MKYGLFYVVTPGYLYPVNATMNALETHGSECCYDMVYANGTGKFTEYMEKSKTRQSPVAWTHTDKIKSKYLMNWDFYKYQRALDVWDQYDAIGILDADTFVCGDVDSLFKRCINEGKIVLNSNPKYSSGKTKWTPLDPYVGEWDKGWWYYVDQVMIFNTHVPKHKKILEDWLRFCTDPVPASFSPVAKNPCGGLNRSICLNIEDFKKEVIEIFGWVWFSELYVSVYKMELIGDKLYWREGPGKDMALEAIHNRWWQPGRAMTDFGKKKNDRFFENINFEKKLMDRYHDLKFSDLIEFYHKGPIKYDF